MMLCMDEVVFLHSLGFYYVFLMTSVYNNIISKKCTSEMIELITE